MSGLLKKLEEIAKEETSDTMVVNLTSLLSSDDFQSKMAKASSSDQEAIRSKLVLLLEKVQAHQHKLVKDATQSSQQIDEINKLNEACIAYATAQKKD